MKRGFLRNGNVIRKYTKQTKGWDESTNRGRKNLNLTEFGRI